MRLVDAHCHLESGEFRDNLADIIGGAREAGVVKLITCSITPAEWDLSRSIAERFPEVEFALGVHPWYIRPEDGDLVPGLAEARLRGAVAIGEIGLDKKTMPAGLELQKTIFEAQLLIAREIDLPVIVHCRGAFEELLHFCKKTGLPRSGGIIHSFSGSAEIAEEFIRYGFSFSLGGTLTYRNSRKRQALLKAIYPDHLLLETDSPDIPPVEARGRANVPSNIRYNLRAASEMLGVGEEEIAENTTRNAMRIFNLTL